MSNGGRCGRYGPDKHCGGCDQVKPREQFPTFSRRCNACGPSQRRKRMMERRSRPRSHKTLTAKLSRQEMVHVYRQIPPGMSINAWLREKIGLTARSSNG
jgi:hypothetical protein